MSDRKAFQFCTFLGEGVATKSLKENHWQNMSIKENPFCTKKRTGGAYGKKEKTKSSFTSTSMASLVNLGILQKIDFNLVKKMTT